MNLTIENQCEPGVDITHPIAIKAGTAKTIQVASIDTVTLEYTEKGLPPQSITRSNNVLSKLALFRMTGTGVITLR
jgi:hypothetical protein